MSTQTEKGFFVLTPEEAKELGGNALTIPKTGVTWKSIVFGAGGAEERIVEQATWQEVGILESIEVNESKKEGWAKDFPGGKEKPAEAWIAKWRISQVDGATENPGKHVTDFMDFIYGLKYVPADQLKEFTEKYKGTQDPKRFWLSRFYDLQRSVQKMATILRLGGHEDRLASGRFFMGFGSCFDVLPTLRGGKYLLKIQQQEDKNGVPRDSIVGVSEFKRT